MAFGISANKPLLQILFCVFKCHSVVTRYISFALSVAYGASSPKVGAFHKVRADMEFLAHNLIGVSKPPPYDMENILQVCTKK